MRNLGCRMNEGRRWWSDGFEFTCWNGDIVRGAFIIDAHDGEIIAWRTVVNAGIIDSNIRDIMLEAVDRRFGGYRAPSVIEMLTDNGSPCIAKDTQISRRVRPLVSASRTASRRNSGVGLFPLPIEHLLVPQSVLSTFSGQVHRGQIWQSGDHVIEVLNRGNGEQTYNVIIGIE